MTKEQILTQIREIGIVPVIKIDDTADAVPLAQALIDGGLPCAEITFRTDAAEGSIKLISDKFPDMFIGAGTVLTTEQADRAIAAGAKFIVSPGFNSKVVKHCQSKNVPIFPGCITPTEIEMAIEHGLDTVKFFPAEQAGGLSMIKALAAPYTKMTFIPTGGVDTGNLAKYLEFGKIIACGGSFMIKPDLAEVTRLSKEAVKIVKEVRG
ncbi:MAG: bifunctional 4-hydroxy-2-oxoglutarate aldolase/2-dehydro-3-deoxy-phosphogluconate aldolase [Oscillospiraceae bacterium]|nr:bifunctional 4-hydroxy-2-oxoglutarate aldolase/2-dehydro-3-deoxy-phosphogluconate aldolase [Oscillospiraceae bacterium]